MNLVPWDILYVVDLSDEPYITRGQIVCHYFSSVLKPQWVKTVRQNMSVGVSGLKMFPTRKA